MPRRVKTSSSTSAASASSPGSTRSRLETSVTSTPSALYGAGELGAGDARADHDQVSRQLVEVVDLLPGQDPLAVGLRGRQHARGGAGGEQHGVGLERLLGAVGAVAATTPLRAVEPAAARASTRTPSRVEPALDVGGLAAREPHHPLVDPGQVDATACGVALAVGKRMPSSSASAMSAISSAVAIRVLLGHAVGEHRRPAEAVACRRR